MKNLNRRITKEMNRHSNKDQKSNEILKNLNIQKMQLYSDYAIWIENLKNSMHLCKYRQVIGEIESRKNNFRTIEELHWKYQYIEIDAIFKILKKKFLSHRNDISNENSHQYHSCIFWFNQIYIILEQLLLENRPDLNPKLDYSDEDILKPVQCIIDSIIKFCFLLLIFAQYNQQLPDILCYLSIIERLVPYMKYTSKSTSYIYLQKILLFKVKILTENCDYMNAVDCLESNINFCFEYIRLLSDEDFNVYIFDLTNEKNRKFMENLNKRRLFKSLQYRELMKQKENIKDNLNYKSNSDLIELNKQRLKNFENLDNMKNSPKKILNRNKLLILEEKKITSSFSNITINTNSTKNNNNLQIKKTESQQMIPPSKRIKKMQSIKNSNKNLSKTIITPSKSSKTRKVILLNKKPLKKMEKGKKSIIEEIFSNMALNFYLRAAIFEHVGNIDSALDSYKEVEWFSIKFLNRKFPYFVKYMTSLLNCAWNNYNIIYKLKYEREKIKQKNEIIRNIEMIKRRQKIEAQERNNAELLRFKSSKLYNNRKLNKFLKELGNKIYKEEELRNFNIYNKFTKTGYILSTYKMIDDLLSDDFRKILKNMKKVDVTKPEEEIQDLIDKALMKKQHQNSIKENPNTNNNLNINNNNNSNTINYNNMNNNMNYNSNKKIINFNLNNTKTSSLIMKESTTINNKNEINSFSQIKSQIASLKKRINKRSDKLIRRLIENSSRKFSTSCEVSTKNFKNTISLNSYFEHSNRKNHKLMDGTKIEDRNNFRQIYKIKSTNNSVIPKINSLTSCYRSSYSKEKVEKYNIDKDSFNKTLIKKKSFLDRYSSREFNFLKNLLKSKSLIPEVVRPIDDLGLKKVRQDADLNFNMKLEIAKSGRGKKNLSNLIKQNINIISPKDKKINNQNNNLERNDTEESENNMINIDNNEKLRQIENDYINIISKQNQLIKRKKWKNNPI